MLLSDLGETLRKARKAQGLTLKQLAERAGLHFTTLSSLERGRVSDLGVRKFLRVAETLGLELVLRPEGHSYTLDDVAKERSAQLASSPPPKTRNEKGAARENNSNLLREQVSQPASFTEQAKQAIEVNKLAELVEQANDVTELSALAKQVSEANKLAEFVKQANQYGVLGRALRGPATLPTGLDIPIGDSRAKRPKK